MNSSDYLRLRTNPKPETPPQGNVDLFFDREDGVLKTRDAGGDTAVVGGAAVTAAAIAAAGGALDDLSNVDPSALATAGAALNDFSNIDPPTGRDALFVGDSYSGVNYLPLAVSRVWKDGRVEDSRPPLTVMIYGDSLSASLADGDLFPDMLFCGWKLMTPQRATVMSGSLTQKVDGNWLHTLYVSIAASSAIEWAIPGVPANGGRANRIGVLYYKGATNAETFDIEYSQNGGAWTKPSGGTIDTSIATSNVAWAEFALSNTGNATRVRIVTASGKTARVIGCGIWFGDTESFAGAGGFVLCDCGVTGLTPTPAATLANTTPTTIRTPLTDMQVNMILGSWSDTISCWDEGAEFDDLKSCIDVGIVADWVMLTPSPMGPSASLIDGSYTNGEYAKLIRRANIDWAVRHNQNVIDLHPRWRDWPTAVALGMMDNDANGEIHPNDKGKIAKRRLCADLLSRELVTQKDAIFIGHGPSGIRAYMSAFAYAIRFHADFMTPNASLLWEFTGNLSVTGTTTSTGTLTASGAFAANSTATFAGAVIGTPQSLSGAGAVNVTSLTTALTSTGAAQALTLANGTNGQIKTIVHEVDGGSMVLTPTTKTGFTTITFTNAGESAVLQYFTTRGWIILALNGAVAA